MVLWRDDPVFAGLDLEDTYILGWVHDEAACELRFDVELSVWPPHPAYEAPPPGGDYTCYRRGAIVFSGVGNVAGYGPPSAARSTTDPDGITDYGTFDACEVGPDGRASVAGDFGTFHLHCAAHRVEVRPVVAAA